MIVLDPRSRVPVYTQIVEQIIWLVQTGALKPNEQLPSIRMLAVELNLNVNTIKRAFWELESDGVIVSLPGKGNYISEHALQSTRFQEKAKEDLKTAINSAKLRGLTLEQITGLAQAIFQEEASSDD